MILPKTTKNGVGRLSYSQISCFKKSREDYYNRYILKEPFVTNDYIKFGSKVGNALEKGDFSKFDGLERSILKRIPRLDLFERRTVLNYEGFSIFGFIDTCSNDLTEIIDYKTGGKNKEFQYSEKEYDQLHLYALSLRQETGVTPSKASVQFIRRSGNAFKGEPLKVDLELPIKINVDISLDRLKEVYHDTLETAKQIEQFYKENK